MASESIRDPARDHLPTPKNPALLSIDYQPVQVNSIASMDRQKLIDNIVGVAKAGRAFEQAGGKMTSVMQLICELQRDWARKDTLGAFVKVASELPGTSAIRLAYDNDEGADG